MVGGGCEFRWWECGGGGVVVIMEGSRRCMEEEGEYRCTWGGRREGNGREGEVDDWWYSVRFEGEGEGGNGTRGLLRRL